MEKVFPVSIDPSFQTGAKDLAALNGLKGEAVIEKVLAPGKYVVSLKDGFRLTALGPERLVKGAKVQIAPLASRQPAQPTDKNVFDTPLKGERWLAKFPVQWPSGASEVKLQLYLEADKAGLFRKKDTVVHLIFTVKTVTFGQIQWSVYLRRNEVLTQVYIEKMGVGEVEIGRIIKEFEEGLKKKGFSLLAPTVILKRPFKASAGLQLDLQG